MANELIRLDTTIIGINRLINKALTAEEAKVLFTVKDIIYSQQRYSTYVQPVKHGRWLPHKITASSKCSECNRVIAYETPFCPNCGAKMDGDSKAEEKGMREEYYGIPCLKNQRELTAEEHRQVCEYIKNIMKDVPITVSTEMKADLDIRNADEEV